MIPALTPARRTPRELLADLPWLAALGLIVGFGLAYLLGWLPHDGTIQVGKSADWDWHLAEVEACAVHWRHGWLPAWNPWTAGGIPLLGSPEVPAFYPLSWLAAVIGSVEAVRVGFVAHYWLLVVGLGALCRVLGGSRLAALIAVLGVVTCDFLLVRVGHGHFIHLTLAWMPLALLGIAGRWSPGLTGVLAGIGVAMPALGGGPYPTWFAFTAFFAWGTFRLLAGRGVLGPIGVLLGTWLLLVGVNPWIAGPAGALAAAGWWWRERTRRAGRGGDPRDSSAIEPARPILASLAWGTFFIAAFAAPKWLTVAAATRDSPRLARLGGFDPISGFTLDGWTVFRTLFVHSPEFFDVGGMPGAHEALPQWYTPLYLVMAGVGVLALRRRPALAMLAAVAAAFTLGPNLPLDAFGLLTAVPPFDRFNQPERWVFVLVPAMSLLAGFGFDAATAGRGRWVLGGVLGLLVLAHGVYGVANVQHRGRIGWPTGGELSREPLGPPTAVMGGARPNFVSIFANIDCLDCGDPLGQNPPPELVPLADDQLVRDDGWTVRSVERPSSDGETGQWPEASKPFAVEPAVESLDWQPSRIRFVAAESGPHTLPIAARSGWRVRAGGRDLPLLDSEPIPDWLEGSAPLMVIGGIEAGDAVELRYRPPGFVAAVVLFLLGLAATPVALRRSG